MTRNRIPLHLTGNVSSPGRSLSPASDGVGGLSPVRVHEGSPVAAQGAGAYGVVVLWPSPSGAK